MNQLRSRAGSIEVVKRDGRRTLFEPVKIQARFEGLCQALHPQYAPALTNISTNQLLQETISHVHQGMATSELDSVSASIAYRMTTLHYEFGKLAARLVINNNHKMTPDKFSVAMAKLQEEHGYFDKEIMAFILANRDAIDKMIVPEADYLYTYRGFKQAESSYLKRDSRDQVVDRIQYMHMRVAVQINYSNSDSLETILQNIQETYSLLSMQLYTHATPTINNACTTNPQLGSCYLLGTKDNVEGICDTQKDCSIISKNGGGIGVHMNVIRPAGSIIKSTGKRSRGLIPQLSVYNRIAECWNQGGTRKGAISAHLAVWHGDIIDFIDIKRPSGSEEMRCRNLFPAGWLPELFMKRLGEGEKWTLFSASTAPGLDQVYDGMLACSVCNKGMLEAYNKFVANEKNSQPHEHKWVSKLAFTELYTKYEAQGKGIRVIDPNIIFDAICQSQMECGVPYVGHIEHVNRKSNQQNIGTIASSNLCMEIVEYSDGDEYAVCNLCSINLPKFVVDGKFDYAALGKVARKAVVAMNKVIDRSWNSVEKARTSNPKTRPLAIGIQGLADTFALLRLPFESAEAARIDLKIAETIYYYALTESIELAERDGPYPLFAGSPMSRGVLCPHMWHEDIEKRDVKSYFEIYPVYSGEYDWGKLAERAKKGVRNSLLVAHMPTQSTAILMDNSESFEPRHANVYTHTNVGGKITVYNNIMLKHLQELELWNEEVERKMIEDEGSIQNVSSIPKEIRDIYKTVWEIKQSYLMKRMAARSAFIDQSSSFNVHHTEKSMAKFRAVLWLSYILGNKTAVYYSRTKAVAKQLPNNISINTVSVEEKTCNPNGGSCDSCSA